MKFTAALLHDEQSSLSLEQVLLGNIRPNEVLVRVVAAGICDTDSSVRNGHIPVSQPIILGHEGSGVVERIGSHVTKVAIGDPVALTFMSCGGCPACASAESAYCDAFGPLNLAGLRADGSSALSQNGAQIGGHFFGQSSFAQYSVANQRNVVKVRRDVQLECVGPLAAQFKQAPGPF